MISILIIVYDTNVDGFVIDCLNSINDQTHDGPKEVVIVSDKGNLLVQKYDFTNESITKKIITQDIENKNIPYLLNIGFNSCKYEYIAIADIYDIMHHDRLKLQYSMFQKHSDIVVLGCNVETSKENTVLSTPIISTGYIYPRVVLDNETEIIMNHSTVMYKKSCIIQMSGYKNTLFYDFDLWIKCLRNGYSLFNMNNKLVVYQSNSYKSKIRNLYISHIQKSKMIETLKNNISGKTQCLVCGRVFLKRNHLKTHFKDHFILNEILDIDYDELKSKFQEVKVHWINMEKSTTRRERMEWIFIKSRVDNVRISACDGREIIKYNDFTFIQNNISVYEMGCTISHLLSIKKAYENNDKFIIVIEDDMGFNYASQWERKIKDICDIAPDDWEIIKIHSTIFSHTGKMMRNKKVLFPKWISPESRSTGAYLININGMEKIVKKYCKNGKWTIDHRHAVADMLIYETCVTYDYAIPLFNQVLLDSTIGNNHRMTDILSLATIHNYYVDLH